MSHRPRLRAAVLLAAALLMPACSKIQEAARGGSGGAGAFDQATLEAAIDKSMGGPNTCVELADAKTGTQTYRYDTNGGCRRTLPPCATFAIPATIAALDSGATTLDQVVKWDGRPQAVRAWERDLSLKDAFKDAVPWFYQKLARDIGPKALDEALQQLDYGNHATGGPVDQFWMGPQAGGELAISTHEQAQFLQRLYAGKLRAKPETVAQVQNLMVDEIRSGATVSGKYATCPSIADGSRQVGWWIGRIQGPKGDYVFAASVEGEAALPGLEVQTRLKNTFAKAGLWPAMS